MCLRTFCRAGGVGMSRRLAAPLALAVLLTLLVVGAGQTQEQPLVAAELHQKASQRGTRASAGRAPGLVRARDPSADRRSRPGPAPEHLRASRGSCREASAASLTGSFATSAGPSRSWPFRSGRMACTSSSHFGASSLASSRIGRADWRCGRASRASRLTRPSPSGTTAPARSSSSWIPASRRTIRSSRTAPGRRGSSPRRASRATIPARPRVSLCPGAPSTPGGTWSTLRARARPARP